MAEIPTNSFLEWHSGAMSQRHALRLGCFSHALLPTDSKLREIVGQEIIAELLELAFHGRRTMERYDNKQLTIANDLFWPASQVDKTDHNLFDAFGTIIHAMAIAINWERPEEGDVNKGGANPYKNVGRDGDFAGSVTIKSDNKEVEKLPIGAIVAAYTHFLNQVNANEGASDD